MHTSTTVANPESRIDLTVPTLSGHVPGYEDDIEDILLTDEQIQSTVRRFGEEITRDYQDEDNLILVGVLKGAFVLMADLSRHIRYRGFEIPPVFVVGYGLDYAERFRNLPYVATLKREAYTESAVSA